MPTTRVYYRTAAGEVGSVEMPTAQLKDELAALESKVAELLPHLPKGLKLSMTPLPPLTAASAVDAEYGSLYSEVVGSGENSDLWPAKWLFAYSVLRGNFRAESAVSMLQLPMTPAELEADPTAMAFAERIWRQMETTSQVLFAIDGIRRRFHRGLPEYLSLEDQQPTIQAAILEMRRAMEAYKHKRGQE